MKIELQSPYKELYRFGYIRVRSSDRRKILDLYNSDLDRTSITYARYLASIKEGRVLTDKEHADHEDEDRTNDCPDNIKVLSSKDNILKSTKYGRTCVSLTCSLCKKEFKREKRQVKKSVFVYCSSLCRDLMK